MNSKEYSRSYKGRRVVITGGLGFIGSNLARTLVRLGAHVTLVDSMIPEYGGNLHNIRGLEGKLTVNIADVRDPHCLPHLLRGAGYLFNLAGQTSHLDSMHDPETDLAINCQAQLSILQCCRKHNPDVKVVYAGTRQIYGRPGNLPVAEDHPIHPVDINGIHKAAGEHYHLLYHEVYGLRTTALRLTNTIGPRMRVKDARQTFVGIWIRLLLEGKPIEVWGGDQLRDFTYVDDVVKALLISGADSCADGKVYNLGGREVVTLRELADLAVDANGGGRRRIKKFPAERKRIDIGDYYSDWSLIKEELGWRPRVGIRAALAKTLAYYRKHLEHYL